MAKYLFIIPYLAIGIAFISVINAFTHEDMDSKFFDEYKDFIDGLMAVAWPVTLVVALVFVIISATGFFANKCTKKIKEVIGESNKENGV